MSFQTSYESEHAQTEWNDRIVNRIVTTLPGATEIVSLLGLEDELVGITHECDYPPSVRKKPVVMRSVFDTAKMSNKEIDDSVLSHVTKGQSIYKIEESLLDSLDPDLIITQELCEVCATPWREVSKVMINLKSKPKILSLSPHSLEDVLVNIIEVGRATGTLEKAKQISQSLQARINDVKERCMNSSKRPTVFCLEWLDPLYCSGHWMPQLVEYAGGKEVLGRLGEPSSVIFWDKVVKSDPEVIFVTVCGYDVQRTLGEISTLTKRDGWDDLRAVKNDKIFVLDGQSYFSRSGPRLVDGLEIMAFLLHPEYFHGYKTPLLSAYSLAERRFV